MKPSIRRWLFLFMGLLLAIGCSSGGAGGGGGGGGTPYAEDPSDPSNMEELPIEFPAAVEDAGGGTFTFYLRDLDTDEPITENVTIEVENGSAPPLQGDGSFTIPISTTGIRVFATGYSAELYGERSGGQNILYKRPIPDVVLGEWELDRIENDTVGEIYEPYDETVALGPDGIQAWSGERSYRYPELYYTAGARSDSDGNIGFGIVSTDVGNYRYVRPEVDGVHFIRIQSLFYRAETDELYALSTYNGDPSRLYYRRAGAGDGTEDTGSFTFQGTSYSGFGYRDSAGDGFGMASTQFYLFGVTTLPESGTKTVAQGVGAALILEEPPTDQSYVAVSGSVERDGNTISFTFEMVRAIDNSPAGTLTGTITANEVL